MFLHSRKMTIILVLFIVSAEVRTLLQVLGYFLIACAFLLYPSNEGLDSPKLICQSGKIDRRKDYNAKQKNKRQAAARKAIAQQARLNRLAENERCRDNKQQAPLKSQVGKKDFYSFYYELGDVAMDMFAVLWWQLRDICQEFELPTFTMWDFSNVFGICEREIPRIVNSKLVEHANKVLSLLVAIGWLKRLEFSVYGVILFKTMPINRSVSLIEIGSEIWRLLKRLSSALMEFMQTRDVTVFWNDAPKSAFEDMYTRIAAEWPLIEIGRTGSLEFAEFDRELDNCINHCLTELKVCKDGERSYFSTRLLTLRKIAIGRCKQKKGNLREAPFCVLFTGGSSVGKTCIASGVGRYIAKVGGYDHQPDNCYSMNEQDKFMSGIATHHTIIRIDDIAQVKSEKATECPIEKIILLNNNQPMPATVAEAEKKGQIMLDPRVVTATTNVADLDATQWVNEPEAIFRRFNVHVEQKVRPEYQEDDSERLDKKKIRKFGNDMFPDYGLYRPYKMIPENLGGSTKKDKKCVSNFVPKYFFGQDKWLSIKELLAFLREEALDHFESQRLFVQGQRANDEFPICECCNMPGNLCSCEVMDSQFGFIGLRDISQWYLEFEERICSTIDAWLRDFLSSRNGLLLIGFNNRNVLLQLAMEYAYTLAIVVAMAVMYEVGGSTCGARVVLLSILAYCLFLYAKFVQIKRDFIARWSTCPRPSVWFSNLSWQTKRHILITVSSWISFKLLLKIARSYRDKMRSNQSGDEKLYNEGFLRNEKSYQKDEHPSWGDFGRIFREQASKYTLHRGEKAATTAADRIINVIRTRQCLIEKEDGEFCNIVPLQSNIWLIPTHCVPTKPILATIRRPTGNFCKVILDPASTVNAVGDLSLYYLPEMGDQKDLTGFLPLEEVYDGKNIECQMVFNVDNKVRVSDKFLATYGRVITSRGGFFKGLNYAFPENTFNGLCMGTLVGTGNRQHIAGFHLAGNGRRGGAGILTLEVFEKARMRLMKKPSVLISHSSSPFETQIQDIDVGPLKAPHPLCVVNNLPQDSKVKVLGAHNLPSSSPGSKVITSLISRHVKDIMDIDKVHGPPRDMQSRRHKEVDIAGKVDTVYVVDQTRLDRAYVDYSTTILKELPKSELDQVRKISDDANLSGLDGVLGINAINFSSSRGFPHTGPKDQIVKLSDRYVEGISCVRDAPQELWDEVARLEQILSSGNRINTVFKGSLKDEPTKLTKDKVRVFAACNFATIVLVRKYFLSLAALVQRNQRLFECAVGVVQQSPEWTEIFEHIGKYGWERGIAGDYAKFDARMSSRFMFAAFKVLITIAEQSGHYTANDLIIMRGIATEITYPTYDYFGTLVQFFGSNPSGHPLTVIINSLVNSLYMRYAYYTIAHEEKWWKTPYFRDVVSLMTYGDDNIMTVKKGFSSINHTRISQVFASMGIKYTMADKDAESVPYIHLSEASFLKHYAVWDDELKLYRSPCEEASIAKMLHTHIESAVLSREQSSAEAIKNVALKYFEFGREVYEEKRAQLMEVAKRAHLLGYVHEIPTYEERVHWYREKFGL